MKPSHDLNLLFALLALQLDLLSQDEALEALNAARGDSLRSLDRVLLERGLLRSHEVEQVSALVQLHLERHGNNASQALNALCTQVPLTRHVETLGHKIQDPPMRQLLADLSRATPSPRRPRNEVTPAGPLHSTLPTEDIYLPPTATGQVGDERFQVLRSHARGGLGEVFLAFDRQLQREVALKEILTQQADSRDCRNRFLLEARVTGRLEHPGIVPVHALGLHPDGRPYYVMRFIRGQSLSQAIERYHNSPGDPGQKSLELRQLLRRFQDVCNAIAYAHSKGVLHRDLKPDNVMLGEFGETLIVDWGLAKQLRQSSEKEADKATPAEEPGERLPAIAEKPVGTGTQAGEILGTPAYMSPEQARGQLDRLSPVSDIYSLGATLYQLLTGQPPFGDSSLMETLQQTISGQLPRPSQIKPGIPAPLEAICLKAMALRPEDRYASAQDLARDLERWQADEPVSAWREPWSWRCRRWARRHRAVVLAGVVLAFTAALALGIGSLLLSWEQARTLSAQADKLAEQERARQAQGDRALAQVGALLDARAQAVPTILANLEPYREQITPRLRAVLAEVDAPSDTTQRRTLRRQHRTRAALALLPADASTLDFLRQRLLDTELEPDEMLLLRDRLLPHRAGLAPALWNEVNQSQELQRRFRALVALAGFDPASPRWPGEGDKVVAWLVKVNPLHVGLWTEALRPVREHLIASLHRAFRDRGNDSERRVATGILQDYAADRPGDLAALVLDADPEQFAALLPRLRAQSAGVVPLLTREMARTPTDLLDPPLSRRWPQPLRTLVEEIERAQGMVAERFALCQSLTLKRFEELATQELRYCGYRPLRLRPYVLLGQQMAAAVWTRDEQEWELAVGLKGVEIELKNEQLRKRGYRLIDLAGYPLPPEAGGLLRFSALWLKESGPAPAEQLALGLSGDRVKPFLAQVEKEGLGAVALQVATGSEGEMRLTGVWRKLAGSARHSLELTEGVYRQQVAGASLVQTDVDLSGVGGSARFAAAWQTLPGRESMQIHALEPVPHLRRCRELSALGFRPVAISAALVREGRPPLAASVWHRPAVQPEAREELAQRQGRAAAALLHLGQPETVWPALRASDHPDLRTQLILNLARLEVPASVLASRLSEEADDSARQALILALGAYRQEQIDPALRDQIKRRLLRWYEQGDDPGTRSAVEWLLQKQAGTDLRVIENRLRGKGRGGRRWYVNGELHTMILLRPREPVLLGSPAAEAGRRDQETQHLRRVDRRFSLSAREVSVSQFSRFLADHPDLRKRMAERLKYPVDGPVSGISWYEAAMYCRWLSEREGVPAEEMVYPEVAEIIKCMDGRQPLKLPADHLKRKGYRLPTEAEWEYACRAGSRSPWPHGSSSGLLEHFAWFAPAAKERTWPVGQKMPNAWGFFDMLGNVAEWCLESGLPYEDGILDREDASEISDRGFRMVRGGSFAGTTRALRSAARNQRRPSVADVGVGFRVARTEENPLRP